MPGRRAPASGKNSNRLNLIELRGMAAMSTFGRLWNEGRTART